MSRHIGTQLKAHRQQTDVWLPCARTNVPGLQPRCLLQDLSSTCLLQETVFCFSPGDVTLCADDRHLACFDDSSEEEVGSCWDFLDVL